MTDRSESGALRVPMTFIDALRAPGGHGRQLQLNDDRHCLISPDTQHSFPVIQGVPVLIDEEKSIFRFEDFSAARETTLRSPPQTLGVSQIIRRKIRSALSLTENIKRFGAEQAIADTCAALSRPKILVIGAGDHEYDASSADILYSDVYLGRLTHCIADAHDLPFEDATFNLVIATAVLECVANPFRCVSEIQRVLKPKGRVYADTPFMQQVHLGSYDFTRFTATGHRCLFSHFREIEGGMSSGPGSALAWSVEYFLTSFAHSSAIRRLLGVVARLIGYPVKKCDWWLATRQGATDGAGGFYFFGELLEYPIPYRELMMGYSGRAGPRPRPLRAHPDQGGRGGEAA